jgi:hypothetical protein
MTDEPYQVTERGDPRDRVANQQPAGWPEKCANCGASREHIGFDYADGFNCRKCGAADSDE